MDGPRYSTVLCTTLVIANESSTVSSCLNSSRMAGDITELRDSHEMEGQVTLTPNIFISLGVAGNSKTTQRETEMGFSGQFLGNHKPIAGHSKGEGDIKFT